MRKVIHAFSEEGFDSLVPDDRDGRPRYEAHAARALELCAAQPFDGPVISFDQIGQISLNPAEGAG